MLNKYRSPVPVEVFIQVEEEMNCDGDLIMAIAVADTGLGTKTKTDYNLGNVGNNDRGNTVTMNNWHEGSNAICGTLNNQYLGGLNRIGELSGGGRAVLGLPECKYSKCYASSKVNWNKNVLSIMSDLKNEPINEFYVFRR